MPALGTCESGRIFYELVPTSDAAMGGLRWQSLGSTVDFGMEGDDEPSQPVAIGEGLYPHLQC